MKRDMTIVLMFALFAILIMSYATDITGMAYSRTLGRTETRFSPAIMDCRANEDCPAGYSCRAYGALQRIRRKARTGCVPICEDAEKNRIPMILFEQLKASFDANTITGFDPQKPTPTRYRPKGGFETFLYPSNCKDIMMVVEPFCVNAATDEAAVGTIEINCGILGKGFGCVEDDNGDASCGQPGEGEDVQRLYVETGGKKETSEVETEATEASVEEALAEEGVEETAAAEPGAKEAEEETEAPDSTATPAEIEARDFSFEPTSITIPSDTAVTITVKNSGQAPHTFTIDNLGIDEELAAGEEKIIEVSAPAGTYTGHCTIHESMKMTVTAE